MKDEEVKTFINRLHFIGGVVASGAEAASQIDDVEKDKKKKNGG